MKQDLKFYVIKFQFQISGLKKYVMPWYSSEIWKSPKNAKNYEVVLS